MRIAGGLVMAAVAGFLLGACGGGGGGGGSTLGAVSGATAPALPTAPARTRTLAAPATTTVAVTTTAPAATTTATTTVSISPVPATTAPGATSSSGETPWGWIALVLALAGLAALLIGLWSRRRSRESSWASHLDDLKRRTLVALDGVLARGSVVTGQVQALATEARTLERHAPDDASRDAADVRAGLDELAEALDADRTLRLGSPPPSEEQLGYSSALIRQQVEQLQGVLRRA